MADASMTNQGEQIEQGSLVSLHFSLALESGDIIDSNYAAKPATFRIGDGNMLPGFEAVLLGMQAGDEVETLLQPEAAFGQVNPRNLHRFPIAKFAHLLEDELLPTEVGSVVAFKDAAGFDLPGIVAAIDDSGITIDFNHPLAGKAIQFKATIVSVLASDAAAVEVRL